MLPGTHAWPPRPAPPCPCPQYGNGTLRLTTRQTYQLHGVLKQNLKTVFSTVGGCAGGCEGREPKEV